MIVAGKERKQSKQEAKCSVIPNGSTEEEEG